MANKAVEFKREAIMYLGKMSDVFLNLTKEDWSWFWKYKIDHHKTYFVKGNPMKLRKFEAMFLGLANFDKPLFKEFQIFDYIKKLSYDKEREYEYDCDLLILYAHRQQIGVGNTEAWITTSLIEKIAERNRDGLVTLVLSERNLDEIEKSGELEIIDLGNWSKVVQIQANVSEVAKRAKDKQETSNTEADNTGTVENSKPTENEIDY